MIPNELRIGNYLKFNGQIEPIDGVTGFGVSFPTIGRNPNGVDVFEEIDLCEPIELTEEWLLKFGFRKDHDSCWKLGNCFWWVEIEERGGCFQIASGYSIIVNAPCKYVHQLQNLYFALTGEEL